MLFHPSGTVPVTPLSGLIPTLESSEATKPILSNFGNSCLLLKIPSRLILILHSPFGLPASGVPSEADVTNCGLGSGWWKYQYKVAHNIIAIWRVGLVGARNS